jgi:hypothetical protein
MASKKSTSPQIVDPYAPLEQLAQRAISRLGELGVSTVEAETYLKFIDYANAILDDVMAHPYWEKGKEIPYYNHQTEKRPVPDTVMVPGLLARFAADMDSRKAQVYFGEYYNRLNQVLTRWKFGVGAEFEMQVVDYDEGGVK